MTYGGTLFAAYYAQHASRLPAGYREAEYIESTGEQVIDTGFVITTGEVSVQMDFLLTQDFAFWNGGFVFGVRGDGAYTLFTCSFPSATTVRLAVAKNTFENYTISSVAAGTRHVLAYSRGSLVIDSAQYAIGDYPVRDSNEMSLYVFGRNAYDTAPTFVSGIRCFSFLILDGGAEARKLVPCVRAADGKPGMYDLCGSICPLTGTPFYVNAGTGTDFLWGELS